MKHLTYVYGIVEYCRMMAQDFTCNPKLSTLCLVMCCVTQTPTKKRKVEPSLKKATKESESSTSNSSSSSSGSSSEDEVSGFNFTD